MIDANPVSIPMDPGQDLSLETGEDVHNVPYREAIGSLMYLAMVTRPDVCYAVNRLSQYMERPKQKHWNGVKKVLKYLKSSVNYGILQKTVFVDIVMQILLEMLIQENQLLVLCL